MNLGTMYRSKASVKIVSVLQYTKADCSNKKNYIKKRTRNNFLPSYNCHLFVFEQKEAPDVPNVFFDVFEWHKLNDIQLLCFWDGGGRLSGTDLKTSENQITTVYMVRHH